MKTRIAILLCLAFAFPIGSHTVWARSKKKKKEAFVPAPTPTPPGAPSGDLSSFVAANGDKIFAPLDQKVVMPRAGLAQLRNSFAQRFTGASLVERNQFQAALSVCDALTQVMNERDKAVLSPSGNWPARAAQLRQYIDGLLARGTRDGKPGGAGATSPGR